MRSCISLQSVVILSLSAIAIQAFAILPITGGVNPETGERPARKEIVQFSSSGAQWDLYILSMQAIQQASQEEQLSWFQVSGIHGYPAVDWDGVTRGLGCTNPGYASHGDILFLPWHRAYLALLETIIWEKALEIASTYYSDLSRYLEAANTLRLPYWDWGSERLLPDVLTSETLTVNGPNGTETVRNPLASYVFHPHPSSSEFPPGGGAYIYNNTVRNPVNWAAGIGVSNITEVNMKLSANYDTVRDSLYHMFSVQSKFAPFSNMASPRTPEETMSLEGIHANAHNEVGGDNGHMTELLFSAFDPIFFLHHANVDRLWAMWSALNPDTYVTPQVNDEGTYSELPGTSETDESPLFPFHRDVDGNFHTANTVRYPKDLGYTYVELEDWKYTPDEVITNVKAAINNLYGTKNPPSTAGGDASSDPDSQQREWLINFRVARNVGKAVDFYFFFGDPPANAEAWATASNRILTQVVMAKMTSASVGTPTISQLPITRALAQARRDGRLADLDVESVKAFVRTKLQWRVRSHDGSEVVPSALQGLGIQIIDQVIQPGLGHDELSSLGQATIHDDLILMNGPYGGV